VARKWNTLAAVSIATFMLLLDITIVNVALPEIQIDLGASFDELRWVIDAYALTLAATVLVFGSLADRLGRRRMFTIGLACFSLASLACGLAWDPLALDIFRGAQGLGGAMMFSTTLALIAAVYEGADRTKALTVWGATTAAAVAAGPLIGGVLVEAVSWESIFYVNVPIGLLTAFLVAEGVPESTGPEATGRADLAGVGPLAGSAGLLVLALFRGNEEGWGSAPILVMFGASTLLLAAFIAIERRTEQPLLDLGMFRKPSTWGASLSMLATAMSIFAMFTFLVLYIQSVLGYDALETGLRLLPLTAATFVAAAIAGRLGELVPLRYLIASGLAVAGTGLLINRQVDVDSDWTAILAGGILMGVGAGAVMPSVAAAALGTVPVGRSGMASGLNSTFRSLGVAIGVGGLGAIVEGRVSSSLTASLDSVPSALVDAVASGNLAAVGAEAGPRAVVAADVAFVAGFDAISLVAALVAFTGAALALLLIREADFGPARTGPKGERSRGHSGAVPASPNTTAQPRVAGASEDSGDEIVRRAFDWSRNEIGAVATPITIFAHHPTLLAGYSALELALERSDLVSARLKYLAAMRTTMVSGCEWCLDFGSAISQDAAVSEEDLRALAMYRSSARFNETEKLVLDYADAMTRTPTAVSDGLFRRLRQHFNEAELVELTTIVALENMRSRFNRAFRIDAQGFAAGSYCVRPAVADTADGSERSGSVTERHRALAKAEFEIWGTGEVDRLDEVVAADVIHHDPHDPHAADGLDGLKTSIRETRDRFGNFEITVLDQLAEGDRVATRWRATMAPAKSGAWAADPGSVTMDGITIERFADGKVVESWRSMDRLGLLQKLGLESTTGAEGTDRR
jgi:EmrB/QacA subfamily drug resistance transporter